MSQRVTGAVHARAGDESASAAAGDAVRRVRPKHTHDDTASAAAAGSGNAAALPLIQRLHLDALQSVFGFLDVCGFASVLRVSREWCHLVRQRLPCGRLVLDLPRHQLLTACQSSLARHIEDLAIVGTRMERLVIAESLFALSRTNFTHLRKLQCDLDAPHVEPFHFPATLQELCLKVWVDNVNTFDRCLAVVNAVFSSVVQLKQLHSLGLSLPRSLLRHVSFAVFQRAPQLRALTIDEYYLDEYLGDDMDEELDEEDIPMDDRRALMDDCRLLTQLRSLMLPSRRLKSDDVVYLLRAPHQLRLQLLGDLPEFTDEMAASLPTLLELEAPDSVTCTDFSFLAQLRSCHKLTLDLEGAPPASFEALLEVSAAGHLAPVRSLSLADGAEAPPLDEWQTLLAGMPQLTGLSVSYLHLESLQFLASPQLAASLTSLRVVHCWELPVDELKHVHGLKALRTLDLTDSFTTPLPSYVQGLFEPGQSPLLPLLESFRYSAPVRMAPAGDPFEAEWRVQQGGEAWEDEEQEEYEEDEEADD